MAKKVKQDNAEGLNLSEVLGLDKVIEGVPTETIRFEYKNQADHVARLKDIRSNLGKRFKAVVEVNDHTGNTDGNHVVFFKVQR